MEILIPDEVEYKDKSISRGKGIGKRFDPNKDETVTGSYTPNYFTSKYKKPVLLKIQERSERSTLVWKVTVHFQPFVEQVKRKTNRRESANAEMRCIVRSFYHCHETTPWERR